MSTKPNYRIYDGTGSGATKDIVAVDLDDAIEQGREWIQEGDWASEDGVIRIALPLKAEVREIMRSVYYVDRYRDGQPRDIRGPYRSLDEARSVLAVGEEEISANPYEGVLSHLARRHEGASVSLVESWAAEYDSDSDNIYAVTGQSVDGEVDDIATDAEQANDCSGSHSDPEPDCEAGGGSDSGGHDWQAPHCCVGGIKDNPGFWSMGGTRTRSRKVCARCGRYRTEHSAGAQRNDGEPAGTVVYEDPDDKSTQWLISHHEDDGWIPQWLADRLDVPPTTRFTNESATEYVETHDDDDEHNDDTLEHVFAALHLRRADDQDRAYGLWSMCCAAV